MTQLTFDLAANLSPLKKTGRLAKNDPGPVIWGFFLYV
jgi:hypothetical protein